MRKRLVNVLTVTLLSTFLISQISASQISEHGDVNKRSLEQKSEMYGTADWRISSLGRIGSVSVQTSLAPYTTDDRLPAEFHFRRLE